MNPGQEQGPPSYEQQPAYPYGPPPQELGFEAPRPARSRRRAVAVTALIALAMAVAGGPLGLLWSWLAPSVPVVNAGQNGIVVNDPSPEEYIAADGWFTIIGFAFGLVAAIVVWLVLRRDRGPALLLGVVLGGLASSATMWGTGRVIGLSAWNAWQRNSAVGDSYQRPPDLHAHGALLVAAFAAVIVTTLLAGWSNDPDLDRPGAKPGYGQDLNGYDPDDRGLDDPDPDGRDLGGGPIGGPGGPLSSGSPDAPDPTAAPAPPAPWPADPPRG